MPLAAKKRRIVIRPYMSGQPLTAPRKVEKTEEAPVSTVTLSTVTTSNPRTVYRHSRAVASLAVGSGGFTVFNGQTSVIYEDCLQNARIAKEIQGVGVLIVAKNDATLRKWKDLRESYPDLASVREIPVTVTKICTFCGSPSCHKWSAVKAFSEAFEFEFDIMEHS